MNIATLLKNGRLVLLPLLAALLVVGVIDFRQPALAATQSLRLVSSGSQPQNQRNCENSGDASLPGKDGDARCVNGHWMYTRTQHTDSCFTLADTVKERRPYKPGECGRSKGMGPERIAHSRAISRLQLAIDRHWKGGSISPDIEWETHLTLPLPSTPVRSGRRPDIVFYDHTDPSAQGPTVHIIEVKVTNGSAGSAAAAQKQAEEYTVIFPRIDPAQDVIAEKLDLMDKVAGDSFMIWMPNTGQCQAGFLPVKRYETFMDQSHPAVLQVSLVETGCQESTQEQSDAVEQGEQADEPEDQHDYWWIFELIGPELRKLFGTGKKSDACKDVRLEDNKPVVLVRDEYALAAFGVVATVSAAFLIAGGFVTLFGSAVVAAEAGSTSLAVVIPAALIGLGLVANSCFPPVGGASGDPHLRTLDGVAYDLQSVGEFHLVRAPEFGMDVQARFAPLGSSNRVSVVTGAAFELGGSTVEFRNGAVPLVDGSPVTIADQEALEIGDNGGLIRDGNTYYALWPGEGDRPMVTYRNSDISIHVPEGTVTSGLLGVMNGSRDDDLRLKNGSIVSSPSNQYLHTTFADSWRINQNDSHFTYGPGQDTETFTDRSFPSNFVNVDSYSVAARLEAEQTCRDAGVAEGALMTNCVYDLLVTGQETFIDALARIVDAPVALDAVGLDASGGLSEDFEGDVASNFMPARLSEDSSVTGFAGPIKSGESYGFAVADLAPHSTLDIGFDVVVLGDWSTSTETQPINLRVDKKQVWSSTIEWDANESRPAIDGLGAPVRSGTTESNQPFWVFRVEESTAHRTSSLSAVFNVDTGHEVVGRTIGIDTIVLEGDVESPQVFNLTVSTSPIVVADGQPASGAGKLETFSSRDQYEFEVEGAERSYVVNNTSCRAGVWGDSISWQLTDDNDHVIRTGGCDGQVGFENLDEGTYTLEYFTRSTHSGAYSFEILQIPAPQQFSLTLSETPLTISDGDPAVGAGNIETIASRDMYAFTVPSGGRQAMLDNKTCPSNLWNGLAWKIADSNNAVVKSGSCKEDALIDLPAGDFTLEFSSRANLTGAYSFDVFIQPPAELFTLTLTETPLTISDGVPGNGAGHIETVASRDRYDFTVPSGGRHVMLDNKTCPSSLWNGLAWELRAKSSNTLIRKSDCKTDALMELEAGDYRLEFSSAANLKGAYTFDLFVQPLPETFALTLNDTPQEVSDGEPGAGAGHIETVASRDHYDFTVPENGRKVMLDNKTCPSDFWNGLGWKLFDLSTNDQIQSGSCRDDALFDLDEGDYRLEYVSVANLKGAYAFDIFFQPSADVFNLTVTQSPLTVSNGIPSQGAGNIETVASIDRYWFTIAGSGGTLVLDNKACPSDFWNGLSWQVRTSSGTTVGTGNCRSDATIPNLEPGNYVLEYASNANHKGAYTFDVMIQPSPDEFALTLSDSPLRVSDGDPGVGAGNIETVASRDRYEFSVPAGGRSVMLDSVACPAGLTGGARWRVLDSSNTVIKDVKCSTDWLFPDLATGEYVLEYYSADNRTGTYSSDLFFEPDHEVFTLTLTDTPLRVSDGDPGVGAGNLETVASRDRYTFEVPAGGRSVMLDSVACPAGLTGGARWRLLDSANSVVKDVKCSTDWLFPDLPAGEYVLEYYSADNRTGTYSFDLFFEPDPDEFTLTLTDTPLTLSNSVPGTGAGNIETVASRDRYAFEVPAGGRSVMLDSIACPAGLLGAARWRLFNNNATLIKDERCSTDWTFVDLAAGEYVLEYYSADNRTGTYSLNLNYAP